MYDYFIVKYEQGDEAFYLALHKVPNILQRENSESRTLHNFLNMFRYIKF